jgi:urease accessory protein
MPSQEWLLWQLADSAFPTGGFAHSGGIEAAWQHGELREPDQLRGYLEASLEQFGHASLPFMTAAHEAPSHWAEHDRLCDCFTSNHVANRASRLQGQALLASAARIFAKAQLREMREAAAEQAACCHLAPMFGVVMDALGLELERAARLFVFSHLRGLIAAAVRLGVVGPLQAQTLQQELYAPAEQVLLRCRELGVNEIAQTAPLLDIWQGAQDRLYSRLFQS